MQGAAHRNEDSLSDSLDHEGAAPEDVINPKMNAYMLQFTVSNNRRKFSIVDDHFLLMGLR